MITKKLFYIDYLFKEIVCKVMLRKENEDIFKVIK